MKDRTKKPHNVSGIRYSKPRPLALEQRFMFDGAAATTAIDATHDAQPLDKTATSTPDNSHDTNATFLAAPATTAPERHEIVFIDTNVPDWQTLAAAVKPGVETILLDPSSDELAQIADALKDRHDIDAIHIISHGAEGDIVLGDLHLTEQNLNVHGAELAAIQNALSPDGDLLLYGCDIGKGADGLQLLGSLANLTGADIAASVNDTGGSGGDWVFEQTIGAIESTNFGDAMLLANFDNRLSGFNLSGSASWVPIMFGTGQDPQGDSQAGAADTDIVGDATHGSLYTYYDDKGTASTADDMLAFRLRIDNPTSTTNFGGVAIVGMDANGDGRIDLFFSVDGRNNTQAVRLLDPGTGANISPNTTTTSPLPTGWLANNGVYPFGGGNYSVIAVSSATDPHWNGDADLGNAGGTDVFVNWSISMNDIATVLAKASPTDRNGVYGPRGATGIAGFNKNTSVQYVSFTQTQPGPINGDLNGVGASYDKNATFGSLGAFTAPMTASTPIAAGPVIKITSAFGDGILNDAEDNSVTVTGTTTSVSNGTPLSLTVSDGIHTLMFTNVTTVSNGAWSASGLDLSTLDNGTLTFTATVDPDNNAGTANSISDIASVLHDKTPPTVGIDQLANAISGKPTFTGTSDLADGSLVTVTIDPDNNSGTANSLIYQVAVSGGLWSLNTTTAVPLSGSMPGSGLTSIAKVSATATDAAGNSATATAQNHPTVNLLSTNDTTPTITGTWTNISGDDLTVMVNGVTYTAGDGNLSVNGNTWSLTIPGGNALSAGTYSVTATVTRGGNLISDTTSTELTITSTPIPAIDITGGTTANGTDTTPVITGTSSNAGGYVIVRLDPNNDGNLSDAVTYSVTPDGSGNWSLDTGSATPISGSVPSGGFIGAIGIRATDASGNAVDTQVLTVSVPTIGIGSITSTATTDASGIVNNSGAAANYLNMTEDNAVTISGTATNGFTVNLVISDANGNSISSNGLTVTGGTWSATGLNLSALDNSTLTVKATLSGTSISATDTSVTHDKTAPFIITTTQTPIRGNSTPLKGLTDLPQGTVLTIKVYSDSGYTTLVSNSTCTATVQADGSWSTTTPANLSNNNTYYFQITTPTNTADTAGNLVQTVNFTRAVQNSVGNSTKVIDIKPVTGDDLLTVSDIGGNVTIQGETSSTSATVTVVISQNGSTLYTKTTTSGSSYTAGTNNWSVQLTPAEVQAMANGQIQIVASVPDGSVIIISDADLVTVDLDTPTLAITDNTAGTATGDVTFTFTFTEAMTGFTSSDITVTGGTKGTFSGSGTTYTLVVSPTASSSGNIQVSVGASAATGSLTGRGNTSATATQTFDTTGAAAAPTLTINTDNLASDSTPVITGTTSLSAGAPIIIAIDTDNNGSTDLTYSATVQAGGNWSLDIGSATPTSGSLPSDGLPTGAKITATATNSFGNSTSATGLNTPVVVTQTTNDNTPTITGTWTQIGGDTLSVVVNGVTYSVANSNLTVGATSWSLTPSLALGDGTYNVTANVTRSATTKTDLSSSELIIDTVGSVDIAGGASVLTNDATPVISGTTSGLSNGTVLTLEIDSDNNGSYDLVYHTVVNSNAWSIDTASAIPYSGTFPSAGLNGSVPMRASASDAAGNNGLDTQTLIVDSTPPDIGITSGNRTPDTTPLIIGTTDLPSGTTITVNIDPNNDGDWSDQQTYTTTVQNDSTWSITASTPLSGIVGVRASGTDAAGNTTTTVQTLVIDLVAPTLSIDKPNASVGVDNSADASEDDNIVFTGTTGSISTGSTISVLISDGTTTISDTAIVNGSGNWSLAPLNLSSMNNGTIYVTATYIDNSGNAFTDTFNFAHNKTATVSIDSISQDTGAIGDFITKDNTVAMFGSATANAAVAIVIKDTGNNTVATFNVTANSSGQWSTAATSTLASGDYTIEATVGGTTVTHALTIVDATAPLLSSSTPLDNAINVGINNNLTLTFNKDIQFGSGTIDLYRADNTLVESFNVNTLTGSDGGSLSVTSATITLNPGSSLATGTGYYLKIDSAAITDTVGNNYAGISNATTLNFTTSASADVTPPATPSIDLLASSDSGASNSDDHTADNTPTLRVTLNGSGATAPVAGDVAKLYADGVLVGTATLSSQNIGDGYVDITSSTLNDGTIAFTAIVTDAANNDSSASSALPVVIDTGTPAPTIAMNIVTSDGVINASEAAGNVAIIGTVGGDAQNGDTVTLTINGNTYTGTVSSGAFNINVSGSDLIADSDHTIDASISSSDTAGNTGTASATRNYSVDTSAPTLSSSTPVDNAINVGVNNNITLTFNETIQFGSGTINLYRGDNTLIESFDVGTLNGNNGGSLSHVGTTVTLDPGAGLTSATDYYITINSTAVTDTAGNNYAGIGNATTLNFTTSASADVTSPTAPSIDLLASSDSGASNSDDHTSDNTPALRITLNGSGATAPVAGDVAKLYADGVLVGTATLSSQNISDGYVDITSSVLSDGTISFTAIVTDVANNDSSASTALPVVIDTISPLPTITVNAVTSDGVVNANEGAGNVAIVGSVGGDAVNGDTVSLTINGNTYTGSVSNGAFSINVAGNDLIADSDHIIDASISTADIAGNIGTAAATRSFATDTAPSHATLTLNPINSIDTSATGAIPITGSAGGDARDGDIVTLVINNVTYTGIVSGGVFTIAVNANDLIADPDRTVDASIATASSTGNSGITGTSLGYTLTTPAITAPPVIPAEPVLPTPPVEPIPVVPPSAAAPIIVTAPHTSAPVVAPTIVNSVTTAPQSIVIALPSAISDIASNGLTQALWGDSNPRPSEIVIESVPATPISRSSSNISEVLTSPGANAFRVAVIKSNEETLMLFKGIADQDAEISSGRPFVHFVMPADTFAHTNPKAVIYLSARLANGESLPAWLSFNPNTGAFEGEPPTDNSGDIQVVVIARDNAGREATAIFRIRIDTATKKITHVSRPSLNELIRMRQDTVSLRRYS